VATSLILGYAIRMLDTVAPVCLGTIERAIGRLDNVGEIPTRMLRLIRRIVNEVLITLDCEFTKIYADSAVSTA
jgi:hypothetical protein